MGLSLLVCLSCGRFGYEMLDVDASSMADDSLVGGGSAGAAEAGASPAEAGAGGIDVGTGGEPADPGAGGSAGSSGEPGAAGALDPGSAGAGASVATAGAGGDPGSAGSGGAAASAGTGGSPGSAGSGGAAATGGTGGDPGSAGTAGAGGAGAAAGTGGSPGTCSSFGPFGTPELLTGFGVDALWSPTLSADGSTLVFADNNPPDVYESTRSGQSTVFSAAAPLGDVNTTDAEVTPFLSFDGLSLYFATTQNGAVGTRDIVVATRPALDQPFGSPTAITAVNSTSRDNLPRLSEDELTILFTSERPQGLGGEDIWMSTRPSKNDSFAAPTNVAELNTAAHDASAVLSRDGLTVFFTSTRPSLFGDRDIWFATRQTVGSAFEAPQKLTEVNSTSIDTDPMISWDGTELIFSSARGGTQQLWRSLRVCQD